MANSFDLRVKQVHLGITTASMRTIVVLLLGGLVAIIGLWQARLLLQTGTTGAAITVQRITLPARDSIIVEIKNSGTEPLTVAQLQVDAAYWDFALEPSAPLQPGKRATLKIPYLWMPNEPHTVTIVTGSGATFEQRIDTPNSLP